MKKLATSLIGAALLAVSASANATILTTGVWTPLPGTTVAAQPQLEGIVLEDESQTFSFAADGGIISGTVQSRVVRSTLDGTLDFYWRVFSDTASTVPLAAFRLGNFITPVYDANWRIDGLGDTAPSHAMLFSSSEGNINFIFDSIGSGGLAPGNSTRYMMFDTNATSYARIARYDLTGQQGISGLFDTFAPSAVPEPGSVALLTLGIAGLALVRRRRN